MATLAEGGTVDLDTALEVIEKGMDVPREARPESPVELVTLFSMRMKIELR